jgi:UDP:flavonoid glycosyltransferase YjiC (YdhE family)
MLRFLDVILPPLDESVASRLLSEFSLTRDNYVLVVPGGGTDHPGAESAPHVIAAAAAQLAESGIPTLLVGVTPSVPAAGLRTSPRMPIAQLAELMRGARVVVSNGGDTLLQAIASARPCVAVPIAHDQARRIAKCEKGGLAIGVKIDAEELVREATRLFTDERARADVVARLAAADVRNGMDVALEAIERLAAPR